MVMFCEYPAHGSYVLCLAVTSFKCVLALKETSIFMYHLLGELSEMTLQNERGECGWKLLLLQVTKVMARMASADIMCVDSKAVKEKFTGMIRYQPFIILRCCYACHSAVCLLWHHCQCVFRVRCFYSSFSLHTVYYLKIAHAVLICL